MYITDCLSKLNVHIGCSFKLNGYTGCLFKRNTYTDCLYKIKEYTICLFKINVYTGCLSKINVYIDFLFKINECIGCLLMKDIMKPECVLSLNMSWRIYKYGSMLRLEDGNLYLCLKTMSHTIYAAKFEQTIIHQHVLLRRESQSHEPLHVLMRLIIPNR
jgi:hypothetical protein